MKLDFVVMVDVVKTEIILLFEGPVKYEVFRRSSREKCLHFDLMNVDIKTYSHHYTFAMPLDRAENFLIRAFSALLPSTLPSAAEASA